MLENNVRTIKHKVGLLNLAEELGNVSRACKTLGLSRDTFYRYKTAVEQGVVESLFDKSRRQPNLKNRVDGLTEQPVLTHAIDYLAHGQLRVSNELHKTGVFVSPSGVRSIWLRHGVANFKDRLKTLEAKVAEQGIILTEAQVAALEKKRQDDEVRGEIDTAHRVIRARRTPSMSTLLKVSAGFISKILSTPIPRWLLPSSTPSRHRSRRPIS